MSAGQIPPMMLIGAAGFALLVIGAGSLLAMDSRSRLVEQRTKAVATSYAPVVMSAGGRSLRLKGAVKNASPLESLGKLIGLEPGRPDLYPVPWWTVPLAMFGFGFFLAKLVVFLVGDIGWVAWPAGWFLGSRWLLQRWLLKYRNELIKQLPDALAMIVRTVRAGIPVTEACQVAARESPALTAAEFGILSNEISVGRTMEDGLWKMAARTGLREYRFLAVALTLQAQTGGNLTETLEKLADVIRRRSALRQRGKALTSEGRATAVVLTILPFLVAAALTLVAPTYIVLLITDPLGKKILLAAITCLCLGLLTMRSMIKRSLS
nr:type II secretion system F family protein [uncultured Rhodopila sp.]